MALVSAYSMSAGLLSERDLWTLSYADIDLRWRRYDGTSQSPDLMALLDEVSRDSNVIFFGDKPTSGTS